MDPLPPSAAPATTAAAASLPSTSAKLLHAPFNRLAMDAGFLLALTPGDDGTLSEWTSKYCRVDAPTTLQPDLLNDAMVLVVHADGPDSPVEIEIPLAGAEVSEEKGFEGCFKLTTSEGLCAFFMGPTPEEAEGWILSLRQFARQQQRPPPLTSSSSTPRAATTLKPSTLTHGLISRVEIATATRAEPRYVALLPGAELLVFKAHPRLPSSWPPSATLRVPPTVVVDPSRPNTVALGGGSALRLSFPTADAAHAFCALVPRRVAAAPTPPRTEPWTFEALARDAADFLGLDNVIYPSPNAELVCGAGTPHKIPMRSLLKGVKPSFAWCLQSTHPSGATFKGTGTEVLATVPGDYWLWVSYDADETETFASPYPFVVTAGPPSATQSFVVPASISIVDGSFSVSLADAYGNPCALDASVEVLAMGATTKIVSVEPEASTPGLVRVRVECADPKMMRDALVQVLVKGKSVRGSPVRPFSTATATAAGTGTTSPTPTQQPQAKRSWAVAAETATAFVGDSIRKDMVLRGGGGGGGPGVSKPFQPTRADVETMMSPAALRALVRPDPDPSTSPTKTKRLTRDKLAEVLAILDRACEREAVATKSRAPVAQWKRALARLREVVDPVSGAPRPGTSVPELSKAVRDMDNALLESSLPADLVAVVRASLGEILVESEASAALASSSVLAGGGEGRGEGAEQSRLPASMMWGVEDVEEEDEPPPPPPPLPPVPVPVPHVAAQDEEDVAPPPPPPLPRAPATPAQRPHVVAPVADVGPSPLQMLPDRLARMAAKPKTPPATAKATATTTLPTPSPLPKPTAKAAAPTPDRSSPVFQWLSTLDMPDFEQRACYEALTMAGIRDVDSLRRLTPSTINRLNLFWDARLRLLTEVKRLNEERYVSRTSPSTL